MLWKKARPLISSQVLSARKGVSTSVHGFFLIKFCRWRFSKLEFLHKRSSSAWQALTPWFSYAVVLPSPFRCQRRMAAAPSWWPSCSPVLLGSSAGLRAAPAAKLGTAVGLGNVRGWQQLHLKTLCNAAGALNPLMSNYLQWWQCCFTCSLS